MKKTKHRCALFTFLAHKHDWVLLADRTKPPPHSPAFKPRSHNPPAHHWTPHSFLPYHTVPRLYHTLQAFGAL